MFSTALYPLKICLKCYSMAFKGNYLMKSSNKALQLEKKQMLTRLSKFSSEFPQLEGCDLITHINFHLNTCMLPHKCEVASEQYIFICHKIHI